MTFLRRTCPEGMPQDARETAGPDLIDDVLARLRQNGIRVTPARRGLLTVLLASRGHRSAEELAADVQLRTPTVNLSTIYRNLDELERLKIVDRTHHGHGPAAYHLASAAHGHLVCEQCGSMTEVPAALFGALAETTLKRYGFVMNPNRSAVIGLCGDCQ